MKKTIGPDCLRSDFQNLSSLELRDLGVDVVGAMATNAWPAQFIAAVIMLDRPHSTPSLDVLMAALLVYDVSYDRHTSLLGDYLRINDWIVTATRRRVTVWTLEAFALVMPLPMEPAVTARLAA